LRVERVGVPLVADAAHGEDELRRRIVALDVLPEPPHVDVHGARLDVRLASPHEVEELEPLVDAVRMADEELGELELAQREGGLHAVDEDLIGVEVEPQAAALERVVRWRYVLGIGAAEHGADARDELARAERLRHVVVGADLEAEHAIDLGGLCGEHDHGQRAAGRGAETPADLEAVHSREHQVEDDEGGPVVRDAAEPVLAALGLDHVVAFLLEVETDELADVLLVLDHEDAALHCHAVWRRPSMAAACSCTTAGGHHAMNHRAATSRITMS